ncbi:MAG: GatB/YqeY domain-containing protein [Flavobacteriaceae bacterium]
MALENEITSALKDAMRSKDTLKLEALRAIKSALLLAKTQTGGTPELSEDDEIKLLQKLVKQRKESATIFRDQNRIDLAEPEEAQAQIITAFLPEQLSEEQITAIIDDIIATTGASSMKDMGQVMGMANQKMAGKADGKTIATVVKQRLS